MASLLRQSRVIDDQEGRLGYPNITYHVIETSTRFPQITPREARHSAAAHPMITLSNEVSYDRFSRAYLGYRAEASRPSMEAVRAAFGCLPNIAAVMATSPVLIRSLVGLFGQVHGGSFSEAEIQTLLLTDAVANRSAWAVAFHSHLALQQGIDAADVSAMRRGLAPKDARLAALSILARTMIEQRGHLNEEQKHAFLDTGFTPEQLLEVVTVVAASTITNYTASIAAPPLEPAFAAHFWHGDMR